MDTINDPILDQLNEMSVNQSATDETLLEQLARDLREAGLFGAGPLLGQDAHGRSLWHGAVALGDQIRPEIFGLLPDTVPIALDGAGRGIIASLWALRQEQLAQEPPAKDDEKPISSADHWLPNHLGILGCLRAAPRAGSWFACPDPAQAWRMADWLANPPTGIGRAPSRIHASLALLTLRLHDASDSLDEIPKPVLAALAFNFALARLPGKGTYFDRELAIAERLLAKAEGPGPLSEASLVRMESFAREKQQPLMALLRSCFESAQIAQAAPPPPGPPLAAKIRI